MARERRTGCTGTSSSCHKSRALRSAWMEISGNRDAIATAVADREQALHFPVRNCGQRSVIPPILGIVN
jgi:hypothetical protein